MNVLSLFDGISCARVALERNNIFVSNYFASEIDKYAIKIADHNYNSTIQLGDVTKVSGSDLPKIDLLIGGFPCQSYSLSGKQLNFNDPRGKLFFECVRLLKEVKPTYFLFENVKMKKEYELQISKLLGVQALPLNSSLLSAQNRQRLYWTNIPNVTVPKDKGLKLKDILEPDYTTDRDKSYCIDANYFKGGNLKSYFEKHRRQLVFSKEGLCLYGLADFNINYESIKRVYHPEGKAPTLTTQQGGHQYPKIYWKDNLWRKLTVLECERLQTLPDFFTKVEGVSHSQRYKAIGNGFTVDIIAHILSFMRF